MSRHHRGETRRWERFRLTILERDGWACTECGRFFGRDGRLEVHHIVGLDAGGARFAAENCRTVCRSCHFDIERRVRRPPVAGEEEWVAYLRSAPYASMVHNDGGMSDDSASKD